MKKRWKAAGIVILTLVCGLFVWSWLYGLQADRQHAADLKRFDREIATLQHDLPSGTKRLEVTDYAVHHHADFYAYTDQAYFKFARISSNVWFCSYWDAQAIVEFSNDSDEAVVVKITPSTRGMCL